MVVFFESTEFPELLVTELQLLAVASRSLLRSAIWPPTYLMHFRSFECVLHYSSLQSAEFARNGFRETEILWLKRLPWKPENLKRWKFLNQIYVCHKNCQLHSIFTKSTPSNNLPVFCKKKKRNKQQADYTHTHVHARTHIHRLFRVRETVGNILTLFSSPMLKECFHFFVKVSIVFLLFFFFKFRSK